MKTLNEKKEASVKQCLNEVEKILNSDLKYGTVTIVIQDGIPIQIDTTQKKRFN